MKNLINKLKAERQKQIAEFSKDINAETEVKTMLSKWIYNDLIPKTSKKRDWELTELKEYLIKRYTIQKEKLLKSEIQQVESIINGSDIERIVITIEWKRSSTWGSNPNAEAAVHYKNGGVKYFTSGSIGGCGYDKQSTAVAKCLNQVDGILKPLYKIKDKNVNTGNHQLFGYGSGYGLLPYFEGGVGVSCYPRILEAIKMKFNTISSGKTFDCYEITK